MPTLNRSRFALFIFTLAAPLVGACGSDEVHEPQTEVKLESTQAVCAGQRATVPASGTVERAYQATREQVQRTPSDSYVAYSVTLDELWIYFSFAPTLPAQPTTEEIRAQLKYAYVAFDLQQPAGLGGALEIVSTNDTFSLDAFEQLEVRDGKLAFRLSRANPGQYLRWLSIYDKDKTNDPPSGADCFVADVGGMCACEFSGPPLTISLAGSVPL
jgi:hypothetical protein